jgi:peptidyl-prolyl cis-trans isomerase SurA
MNRQTCETSVRRFFRLIVAVAALVLPPGLAGAQTSVGVAATVNDAVITLIDVTTRINLILLGAGMPKTPEMQAALKPHVLRILIDERLKEQAAQSEGTVIPRELIEERINYVASRNGMTVQQFDEMLYRGGVLIDTLRSQIGSELAWSETVASRFASGIQVSETEVDARMKLAESSDQTQYLVVEALVAVDRPGEDSIARTAAEQLLALAQQGMPLTIIAQQFSQSPTALNDGVLGWRYAGMLDTDIRSTVVGMQEGALAGPIRTASGYVVLQLMDKRDYSLAVDVVQVRLARMILPVAGGASEQEVADTHALAQSIRTQVNGCDQFNAFARQIDPVLNANPEIGVGVIDQLPENIRPLLLNAEIGIPTESHRTAQGYELFMICEEIAAGAPVVTRDQINEQLRSEALDEAAKTFLSNLRRTAIIEIRG